MNWPTKTFPYAKNHFTWLLRNRPSARFSIKTFPSSKKCVWHRSWFLLHPCDSSHFTWDPALFRMSPPLASRKGRTPRWKYFARMFFTVKVAQNSCRRFSLSGSEKNPFPVEFLPRFTGHDGSCQGALKWIMSHYSQSCLRFMEMFVETIADSSADSLLLLCNFW